MLRGPSWGISPLLPAPLPSKPRNKTNARMQSHAWGVKMLGYVKGQAGKNQDALRLELRCSITVQS